MQRIEVMATAENLGVEADSWLLEAATDQFLVVVAHAVVKPGGEVPVRLMNPRSESVPLQKGLKIQISPLSKDQASVDLVRMLPQLLLRSHMWYCSPTGSFCGRQ